MKHSTLARSITTAMLALASVTPSISAPVARQAQQAPDVQWTQVARDNTNGTSYEIDLGSIKIASAGTFTYAMRLKYDSTKSLENGPSFDSVITMQSVDCKSKKVQVIADALLTGTDIVAVGIISKEDKASEPDENTVPGMMIRRVCPHALKTSGNNARSGSNI